MAQHKGQNFPLLPHPSTNPALSPSSSSDNSLFSANPTGFESDSTTPCATPDDNCGATANTQCNQQLPAGKWQQKEVAENQQHEVTYQPQPQLPRQRQRPYPDEMYAPQPVYGIPQYAPQPAYGIPQYTPQPAYAPNYMFPTGIAPGMMYPGIEMGMEPAGVIPPPPPAVYVPQQYTGQYPPYPYAYPQPEHVYPPLAPQTIAPYTLPSAPLQSAALPAPVSQTLVHDALPTEQMEPGTRPFFPSSKQQQTESILNSFPSNDAAYSYNPSASEGAQRAEEPVVQSQIPAQMQESTSPAHYADLGQQMAYPNAGFMQLASAGSSSVPPSSQKGKGKRRASDDDDAEPEPKRLKQKRLHPSQDPNFVSHDFIHFALVDPLIPNSSETRWSRRKWQPVVEMSVVTMCQCGVDEDVQRSSPPGIQQALAAGRWICVPVLWKVVSAPLLCCIDHGAELSISTSSSRKDSLKRHLETCQVKKDQEKGKNPAMNSAAHDTAEPGPSSMQQQVLTLPLSAGNFSSIVASQPNTQVPASSAELSSVPQQALGVPPPPMFARDFLIAPRPVPQQVSGIPPPPVFAGDLSMLPRNVPQQASGAPPPPIVAADFLIDVTEEEEDDTDLFGSPKMSTLALPSAPAAAAPAINFDDEDDTDLYCSPEESIFLALQSAPAAAASAINFDAEDDTDLYGSPEVSTSLALPPVPAVQEGTVIADAPVAGSAPGFDTAALDMSYDDWMNPTTYADPDMNFSSIFNN